MGLTAGHGIAIGITASDITHGIQIYFTEGNFSQYPVILHDTGNRGHGVRILIGCGLRVVGIVGTACILVLVIDGDGGFHPFRREQLGASGILHSHICVVVAVVQGNHTAIIVFRNFNVIGPFPQGGTSGAGMLYIGPVAVVAGRRTSFYNDKLALVPLGIIHLPAGVELGAVVGTIGYGVGAVLISDHRIFVIPAEGDILLRHHIPLKDLELCIRCDLLPGLTVYLFQSDLQAPLVVLHHIMIVAVSRHCDGLMTAQCSRKFLKPIGYINLVILENNGGQFGTGGCNSCIYHALCFVLQLGNGSVFGCFCRRIRFGLAAVGAFLAAKRGSGSLGDLVMHRPSYCAIAAIVLVVVIVGMAAGGDGLRTGGTHLPAAAVDAAAGFGGRNGNGCPVNLFCGFQLLLIGIDCKSQVKTTAGALSRSGPVGGVILGIGDVGNIGTAFLIGNFRTDQSNNLPCISGRRAINVGVIALARGKRTNSIICPQKLCSRRQIGFGRSTVRIILDDPQLGIIVILIRCFQRIVFSRRIGACTAGSEVTTGIFIRVMLLRQ